MLSLSKQVADRGFVFQTAGYGSPDAERFVLLMRQLEAFSGVWVLTYVLMSNHFHLLCEVPPAQELSGVELLERIQAGYGPARRQALVSSRAPVALCFAETFVIHDPPYLFATPRLPSNSNFLRPRPEFHCPSDLSDLSLFAPWTLYGGNDAMARPKAHCSIGFQPVFCTD
jgi:hypothetical protein